jgi:hypothetical protein
MNQATKVREYAEYIRNNPNNAHAVAFALDVIADAMEGRDQLGAGMVVGIGNDSPDVGIDTTAAAVIAVTTEDLNAGV